MKDDSGSYAVFTAGFVSVTNDGRENYGCCCKATRMRRTSSRRRTSIHSGRDGGCSQIAQNSKVRMSCCQNHAQTLKTQWFLKDEICTDTHLLASCGVGKTVRGSSVGTWMEKKTDLRMSICSSKPRIIHIGVRG